MIRACIFDLDGTLADTLESMASVANKIMISFGLKPLPVDNFRYYCGEGADMLVRRCLRDAGDEGLVHYQEAVRMYRQMFDADPMYRVAPYTGIPEVVDELKKRGMYLAVCSNKPHEAAVKVIDQLFGEKIDLVIGQSSSIRRKPAPDAPLKAAQVLGILPEECLYVGDTRTDMETGTAAGMYTVGVLWGFRDRMELESSGADTVIEKPEELLHICEEYRNDKVSGQ